MFRHYYPKTSHRQGSTNWVVEKFGTGQLGTGQFGTRTIWHEDNLAPGPFGTRTIWHQHNKNRRFGTGQFGTRTIWHQYNKTDNPKRSGNKYDDDRASFILVWKVWSAAGKLQLHALPGNLQLQLEMLYKNSELGTWGQIKNLGSLTTLRMDMLFFFNSFLQRYAVKKSEHFQTHYPTIAITFIDIFIIGANVVTRWYVSYLKAIICKKLARASYMYNYPSFSLSSCLNCYHDHCRVAIIMQERINTS